MQIRQQIVESNIDTTKKQLKLESDDKAFFIFAHSIFTDKSIHSFDDNDCTDGGQDKQIDGITIEEKGGEATIYITQVKNTDSFSSNDIIKIGNGLNWIFKKPRKEVDTLTNLKFKDKIKEIRELQSTLGPSNIKIKLAYITNGLSAAPSDECIQEQKTIIEEYNNKTFDDFSFQLIGAEDIVDLINSQEKKNKKISNEIKIKYDVNSQSLITYHSHGLKGIICTTTAKEIARIVNADSGNFIFDLNIRRYLGNLGSVNKDIRQTCSDENSGFLFWFLNNGVTIVCDKIEVITDPDNPIVKFENMQIVNGCQTSTSLAKAAEEGELQDDVNIMLRVIETKDLELVDRLVLTTNNQNQINSRNLRANDKIQIDIQKAFQIYDLFYERKPREYIDVDIEPEKILPNDIVATSYLAIKLKRPSDARSRKYKIWGEYYDDIFNGGIIEPYIVTAIIYKEAVDYLKSSDLKMDKNELKRYLAKNGAFHIARILAFKIIDEKKWADINYLKEKIKELSENKDLLNKNFIPSFDLLYNIFKDNEEMRVDLSSTLKSYNLDREITKRLNSK